MGQSCYNNFSSNNMINNSNNAFNIGYSSNQNIFINNNLRKNQDGFFSFESSNNYVKNNITDNNRGFYVSTFSYNNISRNNISNNSEGVFINSFSDYNNICENFVNYEQYKIEQYNKDNFDEYYLLDNKKNS